MDPLSKGRQAAEEERRVRGSGGPAIGGQVAGAFRVGGAGAGARRRRRERKMWGGL